MEEREEWGGVSCGGLVGEGVIGVITHEQTAYASHQCSNTLPPLEHSYFQA